MEILFISNKLYPEFEIYEENKMVIHIKIDTQTQSFRIRCGNEKRVFLVDDEALRKNGIVILLNEYGQQLGSLTKRKLDSNTGEIEIEGLQYTYKLNNNLLREIDLFHPNSFQAILSCRLKIESLSFINKDYASYLLFAIVWFTFLTKEQASSVQFAGA